MADGKAQLDVGLDLSGMKRRVEQSEFYRAFGEHRVQIERMIPAVIVMISR